MRDLFYNINRTIFLFLQSMQFACHTHKKGSYSMFLSDPVKNKKKSNSTLALTRRQRECLQYTADGYTGRRIAQRLGISIRMVRFHLERARQRLNASSTAQAVYLAAKSRIID